MPIPLDIRRRGTFLIEVDVAGVGRIETMFCRVPDVQNITGRWAPPRFGCLTFVE